MLCSCCSNRVQTRRWSFHGEWHAEQYLLTLWWYWWSGRDSASDLSGRHQCRCHSRQLLSRWYPGPKHRKVLFDHVFFTPKYQHKFSHWHTSQIKGMIIFNVWLYQVFNHSQCITYSRWRSARPQFRDAAGVLVLGAKQCTAVDRVCSLTYFRAHLHQPSLVCLSPTSECF